MFLVSSVFLDVSRAPFSGCPLYSLWKMKAPPRVIAFGWLALRGGIPTLDNLRHRKRILVNVCPMCLADEETVDHLILGCKATKVLWSDV